MALKSKARRRKIQARRRVTRSRCKSSGGRPKRRKLY